MQASFSDLDYDAKKRLMRRDRFLAENESVTPWTLLVAELEAVGRGRDTGYPMPPHSNRSIKYPLHNAVSEWDDCPIRMKRGERPVCQHKPEDLINDIGR